MQGSALSLCKCWTAQPACRCISWQHPVVLASIRFLHLSQLLQMLAAVKLSRGQVWPCLLLQARPLLTFAGGLYALIPAKLPGSRVARAQGPSLSATGWRYALSPLVLLEAPDPPSSHVPPLMLQWMGYFLLRESMLDSVLVARDRFLAPGGALYPSHARMFFAPIRSQLAHRRMADFQVSSQWQEGEGVGRGLGAGGTAAACCSCPIAWHCSFMSVHSGCFTSIFCPGGGLHQHECKQHLPAAGSGM